MFSSFFGVVAAAYACVRAWILCQAWVVVVGVGAGAHRREAATGADVVSTTMITGVPLNL